MLATAFAIALGVAALVAQPQGLPTMFVNGALHRGDPVVTERFIGLEWDCAPKSKRINETCWAGWSNRQHALVTGP